MKFEDLQLSLECYLDDHENFNKNVLLDHYKNNFEKLINKYKHSISMAVKKG